MLKNTRFTILTFFCKIFLILLLNQSNIITFNISTNKNSQITLNNIL